MSHYRLYRRKSGEIEIAIADNRLPLTALIAALQEGEELIEGVESLEVSMQGKETAILLLPAEGEAIDMQAVESRLQQVLAGN